MKHFFKLMGGVQTTALLHEVQVQQGLWNMFPMRKEGAHGEADDIVLRFNRYDKSWTQEEKLERICANIDCVNYPPFDMLPEAQKLVFGLMAQVKGEHLGRVVITRLAPGKGIPLHSDRVPEAEEKWPQHQHPATYFERYHVVLQGHPGAIFGGGAEQVQMLTGEVWWVDNVVEHQVLNNSAEDRVHLIVDVKPWTPCSYIPEL